MPKAGLFDDWFAEAYWVLSHSSDENGMIPLTELKCYAENFGLIGSFKEFVSIIYAMSDTYSEHRAESLARKAK